MKYQVTPSGCWQWTGARNVHGYGVTRCMGERAMAHRVAYMLEHGKISDGLFVCHRCDNRLCVNPDHLFLGTHADNQRDKVSKGRQHRPLGNLHPNHKVNDADLESIRAKHRSGQRQVDLAREYGVTQTTISKIVTGSRKVAS